MFGSPGDGAAAEPFNPAHDGVLCGHADDDVIDWAAIDLFENSFWQTLVWGIVQAMPHKNNPAPG